jgi:hypothetical protein
MSDSRSPIPDSERSRLRVLVATIDREIARLPSPTAGDGAGGDLFASWAALVEVLCLGPEPELRKCPFCGGFGRRAATRCGSCWARLSPVPQGDGAAPP